MISIRNLSYRYNKKAPLVLDDISLEIGQGEFVALIGQNGAGKTTLLKQLNGLLKPSSGSVIIKGLDTAATKTSRLAPHIGFLFQNPDHQIFCGTVYDEIRFGLVNTGCQQELIDGRIRRISGLLGLNSILDQNPFALSKGERQRVALASVLALETDILVLDEPTTGQDYKECVEIMEIVKDLNQRGKTIIMVSHDMEVVADYCKRAVVLHNGRVLEDDDTGVVLRKSDSLRMAGLEPPQIIQLALRFGPIFKNVISPEDMAHAIVSRAVTGGMRV
ncbi:MAG: ATP-binding cassette domain-containing protein [Clostridiaceae bacterium]|jgi:energy-coupling factor transport system ATP-binding protein|nr:ATP-binding cassette domain-containing protein [Clostridiaceae bacterium]